MSARRKPGACVASLRLRDQLARSIPATIFVGSLCLMALQFVSPAATLHVEFTAAVKPPRHQVAAPAPRGEATQWGCKAALSYLSEHTAPGFEIECPGYAYGHQAMTCVDDPPYCGTDQRLITIADPCPAAYMNEASNSWVLIGESDSAIDPYGDCD